MRDTEEVFWSRSADPFPAIREALSHIGIYTYRHPDDKGKNEVGIIISRKRLSKKEINYFSILGDLGENKIKKSDLRRIIREEIQNLLKEIGETKTFYPTSKAEKIAKENQKGDPDWTYKAVKEPKKPGYSYVEVYDEDTEFLGYL